jgi:hypothetical protein
MGFLDFITVLSQQGVGKKEFLVYFERYNPANGKE